MKEIRSKAYLGGANVLLEFEAGFDADQALNDVREKSDIAKAELPDNADEPRVEEVNLSLFPIIIVTLGGEVPGTLLKSAATCRKRSRAFHQFLKQELVVTVMNRLKL